MGYAGQVSLGQAGFMAIAANTSVYLRSLRIEPVLSILAGIGVSTPVRSCSGGAYV